MSRALRVAQSPAQSNLGCFQGLGSTTSLGNLCHCFTNLIVHKNPQNSSPATAGASSDEGAGAGELGKGQHMAEHFSFPFSSEYKGISELQGSSNPTGSPLVSCQWETLLC